MVRFFSPAISMKVSVLPIMLLPFVALIVAACLAVLFASFFDQAQLRGIYQVWQENETFAAATVALIAAMYASRPVYLQVRAQSVQASLDLLHRIEAETETCTGARRRLSELRRVVVTLAGEIHSYASMQEPSVQDLKDAVTAFHAISPQELHAMAERPTINHDDQMKLVALSAVLKIAQHAVDELLAQEWGGVIAQEAVAKEHDFISVKLAGLFNLSSEIAEDLEQQEEGMRKRAKELRQSADDGV
jgi:hypothetical protein